MVDASGGFEGDLHRVAGVRPSSHWISSYRASVDNLQQGQQESADLILQQILYHDLRDVVREVNPVPSSSTAMSNNSCAQQWRQAVQAQQPEANNLDHSSFKATLPDSFRLMVQVEEALDVARNMETRYEPGGNPQNRCLKMCLTDGYYDNGTPFPPANADNSSSQPMWALEVSPIPNLTFDVKAGAKLLLQGPIDIRWGTLMLHEGNVLYLGGEVPHLIERQNKAVEQARKLAGVGVDPTIRALIWNPETGGEQDEDEGEQESGNAPAARANAPIVPPAPQPPPPNPAVASSQNQNNSRPALQNVRYDLSNLNSHAPASEPAPRPVPQLPIRNNGAPNGSIQNHNRINPHLPTAGGAAVPQGQSGRPQHANPYAKKLPARDHNVSNGTLRTFTSPPAPPDHAANPTVLVGTPSPADTLMTDAFSTASASNTIANRTTPHVSPNTNNENSGSSTSTNISNTPQRVTFGELRDMLAKARQDEAFYAQQYGKVFQVQMQQKGSQLYFNIDKVKKQKDKTKNKKKNDKYEYAMHARFFAPAAEKDALSCKVASQILQIYFGYAPSEMRQLNKTDKAKSAAHVKECGARVKEAFHKLGLWDVTLAKPADAFFRSTTDPSLDGETPILMLLARKDIND